MFGISFTEMLVIGLVALVVVGPQKLPKMLRSLGEWIAKLRRITTEVRAQTGIDDILRAEGLSGGLNELRTLMRGDIIRRPAEPAYQPVQDPYREIVETDMTREYPPEGVDASGALPEDLLPDAPAANSLAPPPSPADKPDPVPEAKPDPVV
ncbi:MAG TPA: Sec-independent protein translocase protein TatB [Polyangiaceae bacterium]|nr:Sec-independent protein translocase protein TatB [Polyangiaceae bacterium]